MKIPNVKLKTGERYRVKYGAHHNPLAGVPGVPPTLPIYLHQPAVFSGWTHKLKRDDVLVYWGTGWSAGSDPGIEELFELIDSPNPAPGKGAFEPAGLWGGVSALMLEPHTEHLVRLRNDGYRLDTFAEFDAGKYVPEGMRERAKDVRGEHPYVLFDLDSGDDGYMAWGDDPIAMAQVACEELNLVA